MDVPFVLSTWSTWVAPSFPHSQHTLLRASTALWIFCSCHPLSPSLCLLARLGDPPAQAFCGCTAQGCTFGHPATGHDFFALTVDATNLPTPPAQPGPPTPTQTDRRTTDQPTVHDPGEATVPGVSASSLSQFSRGRRIGHDSEPDPGPGRRWLLSARPGVSRWPNGQGCVGPDAQPLRPTLCADP